MGDATGGIKCPQRHVKGCPGKLNAISTALQRQKFTSWEDCNHSSMSVDLCRRRHLLEDSDVLLDTQLKPLSQPLVLPLNLSWAMWLAPSFSICYSSWGLQSSSTHTHAPHPGTWCFIGGLTAGENLWSIPREKAVIWAPCDPIPRLHDAAICKSNKKWPWFPGIL